jgi:sodium/bile acid cotransporter 7
VLVRLKNIRVDPFLLMILVTVGVAALIPARGSWATGVGWASSVAIGLLFFLYGVRLAPREAIDGLRHWRLHGTVVLATFVLFPLVGLTVQFLPASVLPRELALGVLFLCCLPSTVQSSIAFTSVARGNVPAASCAASLSNLAGIVITPVLTAVLLSSHGGFSGRAVLEVALQLLAPFVLGQLVRRWIAGWVTAHAKVLKIVDRGSILLVVYTAFSMGMVEHIWRSVNAWQLAIVAVVNAALLAVVLAFTWLVGRVAGLDRGDSIVLLFCGSKKSLASGLPMALVFFPAATVGVIMLPLMIFHQIQLVVCSVIASRLSRDSLDDEPAAAA